MDGGIDSQEDKKPFSILQKFRELKKSAEETPALDTSGDSTKPPQTTGTVLQASSGVPSSSPSGFGRGRKPHFNRRHGNNSDSPKKKSSEMHIGQKEEDVGITEYLRTGPGFEMILKHRFTDFQVNEIDLHGRVVSLTSFQLPNKDEEAETSSDPEDLVLLSPEQWEKLQEIVEKNLDTTVDIDVTNLDKECRQKLHRVVKRKFGVHVWSNTVEDGDKKVVKVGYSKSKQNTRFCRWPFNRPGFLHFALYKENSDMSEVISVLSSLTRAKPNRFGFAGTKDKRSVSVQMVSCNKLDAERLKMCKNRLRNIATGNYCYKWKGLRLGDLKGNRFKIVLRSVKASDEVISEAFESFKDTGFINYFGLQRFGQSALVPTYIVGKAILNKDWELAVELVLKPRPGESCHDDVRAAREVWWETKDAERALKELSRMQKSIEGKILSGLKKNGAKAYQNAFDNLPNQTVCMYLHSYQSFIWNKVVSRRVRKYGLKVLPGDLVKVHRDPWEDQEEDLDEESGESDSDVAEKTISQEFQPRMQVRLLTKEEAETASIFDVIYPLPGHDIKLPDNEVGTWITEMLAEDGFSLNTFQQLHKKYGMFGAYRNMLSRAEDLTWQTVRYSSPDEDLLLTDLDKIKKKPPPALNPEGPYKAIIVEFNLGTCCYATMAMRELAKCDTATSSQAKLTNQAREDDLVLKRQKEEEETDNSKRMKTDHDRESSVEGGKVELENEQENEQMETNTKNNDHEECDEHAGQAKTE